jgi:hypothetical protein
MLTLLAPAILRSVIELPCGLIPTRNEKTGKLILIIKIHKEYILAAQIKGGFSFYLAPLQSSSGLTAALATAFFDNEDEPLLIKTPLLFDDQFSRDILELLSYKELEVYFFDELGREWLGYLASVSDKLSLLATGTRFNSLLKNTPSAAPTESVSQIPAS